jgi:transcriptional regulator with XRE-family HTH domain
MELATKLRTWREKKKWSQLDVALKVGVAQGTYGTWEFNVIPKSKYFNKLAEVFEVNILEFFSDEETAKLENQNLAKDVLLNKLIATLEDANKTKDELINQLKEELKTVKNNPNNPQTPNQSTDGI